MVACLEMADLLALLFVMFYYVFVTSPCGVLGQVWFVVVLIPDFCLLSLYGRYSCACNSDPLLGFKKDG